MRLPVRGLLLAGAMALTGCSMVPEFKLPDLRLPQSWSANPAPNPAPNPASAPAPGRAATPVIWPAADWWSGFGSPELDQLIRLGQTDNADLRAAVARIRQAEAQSRIAGAALLPSVQAGGNVSRDHRNRISSTGYQGTLSASYQLDLFGGNAASASAAETRVQSSSFDRDTVALTLVSDVASTYLQILSLRERQRVAQETLQTSEDLLSLLERQQAAGAISDLEVAQQRSAVASQRTALPALALAEKQSIDALAVLIGRTPQETAVATRSLGDLRLPPVAAGLPSELLQRRPDLRRAEADLRAANYDIGAARAARFPTIQLTADGGVASTALSTLFDPGSRFYSLAAGLVAPLFEGGRLEGGEQLSRARYAEIEENYRQAVLSAFRDVEDALAAVDQNGRQYAFNREALDQAREAYRLADLRYRVGTVDFLTVLEAQRSVFQNADALVQADLARYSALVGLYRVLGGGWTAPARS